MKKGHLIAVGIVAVTAIVGLWLAGPIAQDLDYHGFADQRRILGIPNFWNVVSNLPFGLLGTAALLEALRNWGRRPNAVARLIPLTLAFGIFLACFGSAYYHWAPDNHTLVWDRMPMTLMFMPLLALLVYDFLGELAGRWAYWLLVPIGIASVLYWHWTDDLRPYAFVQFFPMLMAPLLVLLMPGKVGYVRHLWWVLGWYALAKLCEHFDDAIFEVLRCWSGHTIKHLLGAVSLWHVGKILTGWKVTV